jgi:molecular chaperone DnaJ
MAKDYYQILGVEKNATAEDIKKAFHKLAHKHHPDKGGDESKFKEINEAYQILSDKDKRQQYDNFGQTFDSAGGQPGWGFGSGGAPSGWDFESMKGNFGSMDFGDILEEMFGFGAPRQKKESKKGKDIEVELELSLEETIKEQEKEISIYKTSVCSRCQGKGAEPGTPVNECFSCRGTGEVQKIQRTPLGSFTRYATCPECQGEGFRPEKACNVCKGEGRVKGEERIRVFIPVGVDTNQAIKIEGKGEAGRKGGRAGDLYIRLFVKEHPMFKRKGDDLYVSLPISFSQAALGAEIEAPTIEGQKILLKISEGTESGKVLRISNKGIPHFSGYGRGNLYYELIVKTPKKLSRKQKELLEELKKEGI